MTLDVLNLYAGIGGNRKLWDDVTDVNVTAVEWDEDKAEVYRDYFPQDTVVETDAHQFLLDELFETDWDYIWASPPCPTHSQMEQINHINSELRYPDMRLYQEIVILDKYCDKVGYDYTVENVVSYYDPLIEPKTLSRHYFWTNYVLGDTEVQELGITGNWSNENWRSFDYEKHQEVLGYDLSGYDMAKQKKEKSLKNCVHPELGKHILSEATTNRQATLV